MGFYALFRLLWRWVSILYVLGLGLVVLWFLFLYLHGPHVHPHRPPPPERLNLFTLVFSAVVGFLIGQSVSELQHTLLSWTLPNLRRRLFFSLLFVGIVTAFIVTWVYTSLDGPAPWLPIFTSVLLWYSMGLALSTNPFPDITIRDIRLCGVGTFTLALLVAAGFSINRIPDLYNTQPLLSVLLTALGASLYLHRICGANAARENSLDPIVFTGLATGRSLEKAAIALKRTARRNWQHTGPLTGLFNWIRAGEYENFASNRGGWAAEAVRLSGIAVLIVMALLYLREVFAFLKWYQLTAYWPAVLAMCYCIEGSFFLQKGWLYPLSRTQLARLAYWSSLLYNAGIYGIMLLTFLFLESLIELDAGYDFIRPLTLMFIFTPVCQWLRLRYGPFLTQALRGLVPFSGSLIGVMVLGVIWLKAAPGISDPYEVAACAGLILLSQCLFRYKVETYFKRGDLA